MNFCSAVKLQKMSSDIHFPYAEFIGCRPIQFEHRMVIDGGMQGKEASLHVDPRKSLGYPREILSCMWLVTGLHLNIVSLPNYMHRTLSIFRDNSTV